MPTTNWEVAKELFYRALELAPDLRAALLDEECGGDEALRREVESLLDADDEADGFLAAQPALPPSLAGVDQTAAARNETSFAPTFLSATRREPSDPSALVGSVLDGIYRVETLLGRGGMGAVYGARHAVLGDLVAVKVLPASVSADSVWLQRFVREGQAARAIRHPNVVLVHDLRTSADGITYLVMELVEGETLRKRLNDAGRFAPGDAYEVLSGIAGALDAAHAAGVVHRDLKPSNVMLGAGGASDVKVLDLGIAKLREEIGGERAAELTQPGNLMGTPAYMSPEQWGAVPIDGGLEIDGRSDVYSLGVVAFELLTGRLPFPDQLVAELRRAHLKDEVPVVDDVEGVDAAAWAVVRRALSKDRGDRPETAGRFVAQLGAALRIGAPEATLVPATAGSSAAPSPTVGNLPEPTTSFVARAREVAEILAELRRDTVQLLTLTGTGGTGKTRLGLRVADDLAREFPDGVFLVDLSSVTDPALVIPAIARAIGAKDDSSTTPLESLGAVLAVGRRLVMIDNAEHVLEAAPQLADLLGHAPGLKLLVTSRERLRVVAEHEYVVPPLEHVGAVALFVERARDARPTFALTEANAPYVTQICERLDGLPLAIELAAARMKMLSPERLLARLDERLELLTGGARDLPKRQQTMRGALAWSYDLLDEKRQHAFDRLAVFTGGCTLDAVEAVCGRAPDGGSDLSDLTLVEILDTVASLVEKSLLVQSDRSEGEVRFRMLGVVREFARDRLRASGNEADATRRHAEYYLALGELAAPELDGAGQAHWLVRLDEEHDNLRGALQWWLEHDAERCLRLAVALRLFWHIRGHYTEGRRWLEAAVDKCPDASDLLRVGALRGLGYLAWRQGDTAAALRQFEAGLRIARAIGDARQVALLTHGLGLVALQSGDLAAARAYMQESLAKVEEIGNHRSAANALTALGDIARLEREWATARARYEQSLVEFRRAEYVVGLSVAFVNLGAVAFEEGDLASAGTYYRDALENDRGLGNLEGICYALDGLAAVAAKAGAWERAARVAGAVDALRDAMGYEVDPADRAFRDRFIDSVRDGAGTLSLAKWTALGRRLEVEQAIALAVSDVTPPACGPSSSDSSSDLTRAL